MDTRKALKAVRNSDTYGRSMMIPVPNQKCFAGCGLPLLVPLVG
jgi:hypothetical protein